MIEGGREGTGVRAALNGWMDIALRAAPELELSIPYSSITRFRRLVRTSCSQKNSVIK